MNRKFLALDLGAESGRAMLAQLENHRIELAEIHRFPNVPISLPNGLYWDCLRLYYEMLEGLRVAAGQVNELDGVGVDTWGVDFALLDSQGSLLDNPRHYRDGRTAGQRTIAYGKLGASEIFRQTGIQFMDINSLYQLMAVRDQTPHLLQAASHLLFVPDLFNYFLTGLMRSERTIASTSQFYNPVKRAFATDMLRSLGIQASFLGELIDPGVELGPLLPAVQESCGLKHETPVVAVGSHDTASAVAAVPAMEGDNWCYLSSGTWSLLGVELHRPLMSEAALESNFTNEVGVGGRIRFLKNIPGLWVLQECRRAWRRQGLELSYGELMEQAETSDDCSAILDLDLFAAPGNYPALIAQHTRETGQQVPETPGEIARTVLHSLAVRYRKTIETLEHLTGRTIEIIHVVGGGSRNRLLNQFTADISGRRVLAGPAEATAAGNALTQALGTGATNSLEEMRAIVRRSFTLEEFVPNK